MMASMQRYRGDVMVVEDDHAIREALRELLEDEGYRVTQASNGAEALARLREDRPGLILLDLMMPVMDGWEFRNAIQRDPQLSSIPVVILSADHAVAQRAGSLRVQGWLSKPFQLDQLLRTVQRYAAPGVS
jgi:CheY-like chemotaxis protein